MLKGKMIDIEKIYSGELKIKDITLDVMIADAVARKDKEGLTFLQTESNKRVSRKKKNSEETIEYDNPLNVYRNGYLKRIGYKTKAERGSGVKNQTKKEEARKEREDKFAKAFAELGDKEKGEVELWRGG